MPTGEGRPKLTRPLIVETALRLLDEVGLDELTTRRLALEFGVKSPALYWHFDSKQSLLDAMGDEIILRSGMGSNPTNETWQAWVLRRSRGYRAELLRHRDGARVVSAVRHGSPETFQAFLKEIESLAGFGFTAELATKTITTSSHFVTGFVLGEQMRIATAMMSADPAATTGSNDSGQPQLTVDPLGNEMFEHGVALIIAGTERML
jgi:TetR/AcrR family tetracycline transcriptional repressor